MFDGDPGGRCATAVPQASLWPSIVETDPVSIAYTLNASPAQSRFARGFTLIELMVVVAVVAILAAIAYPSYQDSVRKSRRAQAKADLVEFAQRFERHHTVNNTYATFWTAANVPAAARVSPTTAGAVVAYDISVRDVGANTFTLVAAPRAGSPQAKDTRCGTLTLTNTGAKSAAANDCW